ncbi:MAG: hypothetical protein R2879_02030 [Saprospiraceae bacterium]|jgi:hypothetical protein
MFLFKFDAMRRQKKSISELEREFQKESLIIDDADMAKILGGKMIKKNKWNKGCGTITPQ